MRELVVAVAVLLPFAAGLVYVAVAGLLELRTGRRR